uniref:unspecific monooxygenase n=1 Tax=Zygaena filipendulae TaxID=287375 RepID=A0A286MXM5_9NEOP|nr:cytochrome P450 CYP6AW1 [Zygaena filipendulae]
MSFVLFVLVFFVFLVFLLLLFHYGTNGRKYWLHRRVPYREPCPIFGNFGATLTLRRSYPEMLQYFYEKYKDEKFLGIFQARRPTLMVMDLDVVKSILTKDFSSFSDRISVSTDTQREPLLRNLANMSGVEWRAMRHIVTPSFSPAMMKAMFPLIADCAHELKEILLEESTHEVDVPNMMSRYTTDVIGSCAFGVNPGSIKNSESPFLKMSKKMFRADRTTVLKRYCRTFFPRLFKFLNLRTYSPDVETFFTSIIKQVLTERRETGKVRNDFLQLMLNVQKTETKFHMTDELITSNSFIFMLAGLETSATTLSFCLYQLAKDEHLQSELRAEINECVRRHGGLNYEAVSAMRLVAQSVQETLRLHPPTPMTTRLCTAAGTLPSTDLALRVKDNVLIPIYCIQRDPDHFPDPDKFDPHRFSEDLYPPGFLAFGEGPRSCPGVRFGQLMVAAGLAAVLGRFAVGPSARTTPRVQHDPRSFMLKNKGGIWLHFQPIQERFSEL